MTQLNVPFELLREIAEAASGLRNKELWIVISGEPATFEVVYENPPSPTDERVVIHCPADPDPEPTLNVAVIGADQTSVNLLDLKVEPQPPYPGPYKADAAFWSVSAVEKFLVPYYASVHGDKGPAYAQAVLNVLLQPSSEPDAAFAVAHLPSSEYVPLPLEAGASLVVPHLVVLTPSGPRRLTVPG
ncbi:hypothetical protein [Longimicrobium sp.]|uniref:hypothetical protein n=1 Tax=Longimicrobium sp. TaxID=2029185 RepID=UPI002E32C87A|nr:hypothetical protein [Longimicrobium sp.]HEX6036628.1 hypothetical protein [Longimicrobium sp.]